MGKLKKPVQRCAIISFVIADLELNPELERQLREAAAETGEAPSDIVAEALALYLGKRRRFTSVGVGDDPTLDARQTRELLKNWHKP